MRCSGHQETSGSNAAVSALKSGGIGGTLLDVAMILSEGKRGGRVCQKSGSLIVTPFCNGPVMSSLPE